MNYYKYNINIKYLNKLCIISFIPLFIIISYLDLYHYCDFFFLIIYFLWMFLHEFLHGLGFYFNKNINRKNIVYGACLEKGIFYCMCKQEISKNKIILSTLFPFFIIGILTFFLGILISNPMLELLSLFNIVGCVGDLSMFFFFIKLPHFNYIDLDDCTGFVLISEHDLNKFTNKCFKIVEVDDFSKLEKPNSFKKFNFSRFSIFILSVLIIFFLIYIIKI